MLQMMHEKLAPKTIKRRRERNNSYAKKIKEAQDPNLSID